MSNLPVVGPGRTAAVASFIDKLKSARPLPAAGTGGGRLIFALDATASREPTWDQAARITHEMFDATAGIGRLGVQLAFYRGFNECKASRWMSTAAELHRVMSQVRCAAGITQIERVLSHAIRETGTRRVDALVFIGDAMEEPIDQLAHRAGELGRLGLPVFTLHEGADPVAANAFRQIATLSGGAYLSFDLASIARLRDLLGAVAVYVTGGFAALEAYGKNKGGDLLQLTRSPRRTPADV